MSVEADANEEIEKEEGSEEASVSEAPSPETPKKQASNAIVQNPIPKRVRIFFGAAYVVTATLIALALFVGLPTRYAPVDVTGGVLLALVFAAGVSLIGNAKFAATIARLASFVTLGVGMLTTLLLASSAGYLSGAYGAVGMGGAVIFIFVIALVVPYLVVLPSACLVWLGPRERASESKSKTS